MDRFIGLIGLGYWGKNILRNLYELGVLHTACDFSHEVVEERRRSFPEVSYTTDFNDLLSNSEIKAIAIATPAVTHYELAKKALLAGKDVFVEKPMTTSVKEGEELVKIAEEKNKIIMVGHILQYHPAVTKLKELISQGLIGEIIYIYSHRVNVGKIRIDENVWWSLAPHDVSLILMLTGRMPKRIYYQGSSYITKGIDDIALASLEFDNGIRGHIFVSWWHPYKEQKLVTIGSKGMLIFDDTTEEKLFLYPHKVEWNNGIPVAKKEEMQVIPVEKKEPLKEELLHFIECVKERKTPRTDGYEGLRVLKVLEKITSDG
ncbi:Gfo/Idh/MocA family protein [Dictyoglomus thermophilum]|uniref:Oxidoreductase, Gfo/Idh/MocA family/transferase hexapeptide repeat protein n=1 Tax=Dictyoglomus thermophilum (strain ATCC 35947 / DSM 3960 / H-6-12) TaxID=309799 RepID=B5YCQ5_DICT6|nr:Gfo/Idh/MocA family oxidoreductase [Dictyoglomus thermophilum]ACI18519.1 oxidoreductase, Gfo/Idh/MocA family/transferase hexapeptide repeat protein [Dictyoglomus thermophilum H-6-12]